jgi:hypothetical protein
MAFKFTVSETEIKQAKLPHDIFLINLIFNHILVFATILSASSLAHYAIIVPIFSIFSMIFIFIGAMRAKNKYSWYVNGHWQVCVSRSKKFMLMVVAMLLVFLLLWLMSGGHMRPQHWAIGGATVLPVMVMVLILIMMESESLHQAKIGVLPNWVKEQFPNGAPQPLEELK